MGKRERRRQRSEGKRKHAWESAKEFAKRRAMSAPARRARRKAAPA